MPPFSSCFGLLSTCLQYKRLGSQCSTENRSKIEPRSASEAPKSATEAEYDFCLNCSTGVDGIWAPTWGSSRDQNGLQFRSGGRLAPWRSPRDPQDPSKLPPRSLPRLIWAPFGGHVGTILHLSRRLPDHFASKPRRLQTTALCMKGAGGMGAKPLRRIYKF